MIDGFNSLTVLLAWEFFVYNLVLQG